MKLTHARARAHTHTHTHINKHTDIDTDICTGAGTDTDTHKLPAAASEGSVTRVRLLREGVACRGRERHMCVQRKGGKWGGEICKGKK
jgi:hypothetical protein